LFLAYIALSGDPARGGAGIIVANPVTKTALGSFNQPATLMAIAGILITSALVARRTKGALLWAILATSLRGVDSGRPPPGQAGIVGLAPVAEGICWAKPLWGSVK
jgi:Permeases